MNIQLGTSPHFRNKENHAPSTRLCKGHTDAARRIDPEAPDVYDRCWAFSNFRTTTFTADQFIQHILSGMAWIPSTFKDGRRTNENWQQAELVAVDYDHNVSVGDVLKIPFVQQYALLVHPSASSGKLNAEGNPIAKTRVIFRLDSPIRENYENYRLAARAICNHLGLDADPASYKPAQLYYGSDNQIEQPFIRAEHVLPLAVVRTLVAPMQAAEERLKAEQEHRRLEAHYQPVERSSDAAAQKIQDLLDGAYRKVAIVGEGGDRTGEAHAQAWRLAKYLTYWSINESDIERTLLDAAKSNGSLDKYGEREMLRHIHNGIHSGRASDPEPLELPSRQLHVGAPTEPLSPPEERHGEPPVAAPLVQWRSSDESMKAYVESLSHARTDGTIPLLFPFKALAGFGGYARILDAGVLVGVVGMSGGMKTSFLETITDAWRRMDANDILWWGTEWSPALMAGRAIQRYGGAPIDTKALHDTWLAEEARGIPLSARHGEKMPDAMLHQSTKIADVIASWNGRSHQLDEAVSNVDVLLKLFSERIHELEAQKRYIRVCVWDYIQLLDLYTAKTENEKLTSLLGKLKMFCIEHKVVGLVASQVTKASAGAARSGDDVLQAESGQNFRSDKFNLVLTLNPVYEGKLLTNRGVINVAKNSTGKTGVQTVFIDPSKFKWIDAKVPDNQQVRADQLPDVAF